jgi:hypothetical protein
MLLYLHLNDANSYLTGFILNLTSFYGINSSKGKKDEWKSPSDIRQKAEKRTKVDTKNLLILIIVRQE